MHVESNDETADTAEAWFAGVYAELRALAAAAMASEKPGQTLDATALVHEAYLRMVGTQAPGFENRGHFFAAAVEAMKRILIEAARRKQTIKRGGLLNRQPLQDVANAESSLHELTALHDALPTLAAEDPVAARVVELRCFAGLSHEQTAELLETTVYQVRRKWTYARAWLRDRIR